MIIVFHGQTMTITHWIVVRCSLFEFSSSVRRFIYIFFGCSVTMSINCILYSLPVPVCTVCAISIIIQFFFFSLSSKKLLDTFVAMPCSFFFQWFFFSERMNLFEPETQRVHFMSTLVRLDCQKLSLFTIHSAMIFRYENTCVMVMYKHFETN